MSRLPFDVPTGFTGFTIDVYDGSVSDSEGDVTKVLFAITFQERLNDVRFSITSVTNHWAALAPTGEYIGLKNPKVIQTNRDSAIVLFDMDAKYPSNSLMTLCQRDTDAKYNIQDLDQEVPFTRNTITGAIGFTSNEYGGSTNDEGEVERIVFNISFASRRNEIEFSITDDDEDWACLMGDGEQYCLKNPYVLFQNADGATVVFQIYDPRQNGLPEDQKWCGYPSNSPGILVRRREEAKWTITEIDDEHEFISVTGIVMPNYIPVGEHINLHTQAVVYPMNSTLRSIDWELKNGAETEATVSDGWIDTQNTGEITLKATIQNGENLGSDYTQEIKLFVVDNWITIDEQPHLNNVLITGQITDADFLTVVASTEYGDISYQWYKSGDKTNKKGDAIANATEPIFQIPKSLISGDYYYFCEIRKTNFPSVRTEVAYVRVRDALRSLSIYPSGISVPPGSTQQLGIDRNPTTSDETAPIYWSTSDTTICTVDENGLVTGYNEGVCEITARCGNITTSIVAKGIYTPVTAIDFSMDKVVEVNTDYTMPKNVLPVDATNRNIIWTVIDPGTTGATIANGIFRANALGECVIRGTVYNGMTPSDNFIQEFGLTVDSKYIPVSGIVLDNSRIHTGEVLALSGTVSPNNASVKSISWSIIEAGTTGATLVAGNLLSVEEPGTVKIAGTIHNGTSRSADYVQVFDIIFDPPFVPVIGIENIPAEVQYYLGEANLGLKLEGKVVPENAANQEIQYEVSEHDNSGLNPQIVNKTLYFDSTSMTDESVISITIQATVKNGLSDGVDYVTEFALFVNPPAAKEEFVAVEGATWDLPSVLRAYRPIIADKTSIYPYNSSRKNKIWEIERADDIKGSAAIMFYPSEENHQEIVDNGVLIDSQDEFDWEFQGNYIYPMSAGKLKVQLSVMDGLEPGTNFESIQELEIKDPFIPVRGIDNIPTTVYSNSTYYLSPEIDTAGGMNEQTAIWDDRISTYSDVKFTIARDDDNIIDSLSEDGVLVLKNKTGKITIKATVESGMQEAYTWHNKSFDQKDYIKNFEITVKKAADSLFGNIKGLFKKPIITLTLKNHSTVKIYSEADYDKLRSIRDAESTITIDRNTFKRSDVTEVRFENNFEYNDLSNFGRNFTSLTKINKIPESATNLRNFLMGCTSFNQVVMIPKNVDGARCLEGFLRGCTAFNQKITIPDVTGDRCLESFLRDCTSFNKSIKLPEEINGNYAMYSFLMGCTAFNSTITLPKKINGKRCMENVLRGCTAFNHNITLPEEISGLYNMAAFMFECTSFNKPVIVPGIENGENVCYHNDVITFATFHRNSVMVNSTTSLYGNGADLFKEKVGDQGEIIPAGDVVDIETYRLPLRILTTKSGDAPSDNTGTKYVGLYLSGEAVEEVINNDVIVAGDRVFFNITALNNSDSDPISNLKFHVDIPVDVTLVSVEADKKISLTRNYDESDQDTVEVEADEPTTETNEKVIQSIDIKLDTLEAAETLVLKIKSRVLDPGSADKDITFTGTATFDESDQQNSAGDNTVSGTVHITAATDITVEVQPKLKYTEGEHLDLSLMKIRATWSEERTGLITYTSNGVVTSPEHDTELSVETHNDEPIQITYDGHTANTENLSVQAAEDEGLPEP